MLCLFTFGGLVTNPTISLISSDVGLHSQVIIVSAADNRSVLTSEKSRTEFFSEEVHILVQQWCHVEYSPLPQEASFIDSLN